MPSSDPIAPPSKLLMLLEARAVGELATTLALRPWLKKLQRGDGHSVLLLPGFLASDLSTGPLRRFLRDLRYRAHRWSLGRNLGPREDLEQRMSERLESLHNRSGRKVSLVGWSLGGVYARLLANRHPEWVRSVVTLGSPFTGSPRANNSWRLYESVSGERVDDISEERLELVRRNPPLPATSIFSRTDGITSWRTSLAPDGPLAENIQVPGSHLGLGVNPLVFYILADRLSQPEGDWQPFFRPGVRHPRAIRRPPEED